MSKLLLNAEGKVLTSNDKVLKAPEVDTSIEDGLITRTITSYSNDRITAIGVRAFSNCNKLVEISLPNATKAPDNAFHFCSSLVNIFLPNVTETDESTFNSCTSLTEISLPNLVTVKNSNTFTACRNLIKALLPKITSIGYSMFSQCNSLKYIYIEQTNSVCTLKSTNAFNDCYHFLGTVNSTYNPEGLKDGYIQVPASRLAEYKVTTNWVTYESQIIGHQDFNVGDTLPDYTNETFTTQTWYSDETLTTVVTSVATAGKYYCRLEA